MLIKLNIDEVDQATIDNLINFHSQNMLPRYKHLQQYYEGYHDILNKKVSDESKPNNKLVNDYPGYIVDLITGYFMGKPVAYSSKSNNDTYLQALQDIFDYNDEADENAELAKTASIQGEAFELLYLDESGNIRFTQIDNEQTILVYGTEVDAMPVLGIRYYKLHTLNTIDLAEQTKVEVYTKNEIIKYDYFNGELTETERKEHFFKEIPIIHFLNNKSCSGDAEKVESLINAYNSMQSDTADNEDYFTNSYLKITGATLGEGEEALSTVHQMKVNRVIELPEGGTADFMTKNSGDTDSNAFKDRLNSDIHKFAKVPDLSDEQFSGNVSGIAIAFKYAPVEGLSSIKEKKFKRALQRRIELITNILNIKGNNYDYRDIEATFCRNLPYNTSEIVDEVQKLTGIVDQKTLLDQLPFISDSSVVMDRLKQEKEDDLSNDYNNLGQENNTNDTNNNSENNTQM